MLCMKTTWKKKAADIVEWSKLNTKRCKIKKVRRNYKLKPTSYWELRKVKLYVCRNGLLLTTIFYS